MNSHWKCTCCGESYRQGHEKITTPKGNFAGYQHVEAFLKGENAKRLFKLQAAAAKKKRVKHRADKERIKTRAQWLKEAQYAFNAYIRARDNKEPCISCQRHHNGQYHAGHYRTVGAAAHLRFNENNCHKQCAPCNNHLSGNLIPYRVNLISKIGLNAVDDIESNNETVKWSVDYIKGIKSLYKAKLKALANG